MENPIVSYYRELEKVFASAPCPSCAYEFEFQLIDVRLGGRVYCSNCKATIQLVDPHASFERARAEIDGAIDDLGRTIDRK